MTKHNISSELKKEIAIERNTEIFENMIKEKQLLIKKLESEIENLEQIIKANKKLTNQEDHKTC